MTVRSLAWLALLAPLFACSPASEPPGVTNEAAPASAAPTPAPQRTREPAAPKRGKTTLRANTGYYQYVDESGRVRFAESLEDVPERQRSTAGHISVSAPASRRAEAAPEEAPRAKNASIVLYTTTSCPYCKRAIAYFQQTGREFVNKNVEDDGDARDEFLALTHGNSGVPVIMVGDQWIQGWSQPRVEQMLAEAH